MKKYHGRYILINILAILLIWLIMSACGQTEVTPTKTLDVSDMSTQSPTINQGVQLLTPNRIETKMFQTRNNSLTFTSTPSPIDTPFHTPAPSFTPYKTTEIIATTFPGSSLLVDPALAEISPDKKWLYEFVPNTMDLEKPLRVTHVVSVDGKIEWRIQPKQEDIRVGGIASYEPLFWSPKEPYVFLVGTLCCAEGPGASYNYSSLVRFNLHTGDLSVQVPWGSFHDFSFSPNGKYMNRATVREQSIHITRAIDDHDIEIVLPEVYKSFGAGFWAPDGKHFFVFPCDQTNVPDDLCVKKTVLLFEPELGTYKVITSVPADQVWDFGWIDETHFHLTNLSNNSEKKIYNVVTGQFDQ